MKMQMQKEKRPPESSLERHELGVRRVDGVNKGKERGVIGFSSRSDDRCGFEIEKETNRGIMLNTLRRVRVMQSRNATNIIVGSFG